MKTQNTSIALPDGRTAIIKDYRSDLFAPTMSSSFAELLIRADEVFRFTEGKKHKIAIIVKDK